MSGRLLLVGWDAADWKILHPLIDAGEMPTLRHIVEEGASGALLCSQPPLPIAQWTSLLTGKRPWQHHVCHVATTAARRRSLTLWEILAQSGKRSLIVGWPATHGSQTENTSLVSDRYAVPTAAPGVKPWPPPPPGTYWPNEIGRHLDRLRLSPADIQLDVLSRYIPEWRRIDQNRDRRLGQLRLFLATDFSHQTAMIKLMAGARWDFAAVRFPALGAISQLFLPFLPPRKESIPEGEFGLYQNVIAAACRMLDNMLRPLVQAAGKDASIAIVSPHGVNSRSTRVNNNEAWIGSHGVFAASGPAFAKDALLIGASILDVAPTILTFFGLPIGDDMEGRVLLEGFAQPPDVTHVATWETARNAAEKPVPDNSKAATTLRRESDWNLARSYIEVALNHEALPILEALFRAAPERVDFAQSLFQCQLALQKHSEASETLQVLLEQLPTGIWQLLPQIELSLAKKQFLQARDLTNQAWNLRSTHPDAMRWLGTLLLRLREWNALEELATQALKLDENEPLAWVGLAEARLRKRSAEGAETAALRAIGLNYYTPQAHFILARAMVAQGKWQEAAAVMQTVLKLQPRNRAAAVYSQRLPSS